MGLSPKQLGERKARLDELLRARLSDISARQFRELVLIVAPIMMLAAAAIWLALQFVQPAPPRHVVITTGGQSGAYYGFAKRYAAALARHGIVLEVRPSAGSLENIQRLLDPLSDVSVALLQGGVTNSREAPGIVSLGRMFLEPLWVFYRGRDPIDRLHQLKGRRIAVAPEGSGTRKIALALLSPNGVTEDTATLLPITGREAADALLNGEVDAIFLALAPEAPSVQSLLRAPGVKLISFAQADAYTRLFPYLQKIVLPEGAIDFVANLPAHDVALLAPVAALVARERLHPALAGLLVDAAREVHSGGGLFHRVGEFPKPLDPELALSEDAERYYKAGPSFLKRVLPFWLATFIERMSLIAVPLGGALIPLAKLGPVLYRWRIRRRLLYWYGRLTALEASASTDASQERREAYRAEIARIDAAVGTIPVPVGFSDQYYSLRAAIDLVRQRLHVRVPTPDQSTG